MDADIGWRWHMPLFPVLLAAWVKLAGYHLVALRIFGLVSGAGMALLLARCCARLAGQRQWPWMFFWLAIILGDKTFVVYSLTGRMEFWCLFAAIASIELALNFRGSLALALAGALLGAAVGFHPMALYFFPGLLWIAATRAGTDPNGIKFAWKPTVSIMLGFGVVIAGIVLWFLADWAITQAQFLPVVRGSGGGSLAGNAKELFFGTKHNFRFQPIFPFLFLAAIAVHSWNVVRRKPSAIGPSVSIGLLLLFFGFIGFLLRGSSGHLNYYPGIVLTALLLLAASLPILQNVSRRAWQTGLLLMVLLLANNLLFAAAKTRTVWRNRDLLDTAPMNHFLETELKGAKRIVLPPNLWLYGKQNQLEFRINFLTVAGQSEDTFRAYNKTLLDWQPDVIVLDRGDADSHVDSYLKPEELVAAGYVEAGRFDRVFRERFAYDGYRLVTYRRPAVME
jgi:hypothetical protein